MNWEDWTPTVYRFALRLAGDRHLAEDLAQEALFRAWKSQHTLRDERTARVWLLRICANAWKDHLRRLQTRGRPCGLDAASEVQARTPPVVELDDECRRALGELDALPDRQREVLYLTAVEELGPTEIADILDISANAVKASLSIARKTLRERLLDGVQKGTET